MTFLQITSTSRVQEQERRSAKFLCIQWGTEARENSMLTNTDLSETRAISIAFSYLLNSK